MVRLLLTLAIVALTTTLTQSQNYELVSTGNTITYNNDIPSFPLAHHTIYVDSVYVQGSDTVYSLYVEPGGESCPQLQGPSWMGENIVKSASGNYIFQNLLGEDISIKTPDTELPGEEWVCWEKDEYYVKASITEFAQESFLGITDSIKTITFQKYNAQDEQVSSSINGKTIKVSKHHQMIQTVPMVMFPDIPEGSMPSDGPYIYPASGVEFYVSGMSNPKTGIYNITTLEIFDYQPGDEMHIVDHLNQVDYNNSADSSWIQYRILSRNDEENMVSYEIERIQRDKSVEYDDEGNLQDSTETTIHDTINVTYQDDTYLNALPYESIRRHWGEDSTYAEVVHHRLNETEFGRIEKVTAAFSGGWSWQAGEECISYTHVDGCADYGYSYYENLGGPYYYCSGFGGTVLRELVYFNQDGEQWGEPLNILGTNLTQVGAEENRFKIYPNPARDKITIKTEGARSYTHPVINVSDLSGKQIISQQLNKKQTTISTELSTGIYFYRIMDGKEILDTGKLVVQ